VPCGHTETVLIGVSPARPELHVFGTAEDPHEPLVLARQAWDQLRDSRGSIRYTALRCGDHGSEIEREVELKVDRAGLHATWFEYTCVGKFRRGQMLKPRN
jgi:hypothetical protein